MGILSSLSLPSLYPGIDEESKRSSDVIRDFRDASDFEFHHGQMTNRVYNVFNDNLYTYFSVYYFFQSCLKLKAYISQRCALQNPY